MKISNKVRSGVLFGLFICGLSSTSFAGVDWFGEESKNGDPIARCEQKLIQVSPIGEGSVAKDICEANSTRIDFEQFYDCTFTLTRNMAPLGIRFYAEKCSKNSTPEFVECNITINYQGYIPSKKVIQICQHDSHPFFVKCVNSKINDHSFHELDDTEKLDDCFRQDQISSN